LALQIGESELRDREQIRGGEGLTSLAGKFEKERVCFTGCFLDLPQSGTLGTRGCMADSQACAGGDVFQCVLEYVEQCGVSHGVPVV